MEMTASRTLADLRRESGISQRQIGEALGLSQAAVSRIEAQYPDVQLSRLMDYLNVIGVRLMLRGWDIGDIEINNLVADESRIQTMKNRREDPTRGGALS